VEKTQRPEPAKLGDGKTQYDVGRGREKGAIGAFEKGERKKKKTKHKVWKPREGKEIMS